MKQSVSAPVAAIVLALAILFSLVIFSRPTPAPPDEVVYLPPAPPLDQNELDTLRQALGPLGIGLVMPPLPQDRGKGARVSGVAHGSPAAKGGLKPGDLITKYAGVRVGQPFTVAALVQEADPKNPSEVVVVRSGKEEKLVITGIAYLPPEERVKF